jgi:hypothetical protein
MRRQSFNTSNTAATPQQSPQKGVRGINTGGSTGDDKQQQLQQRMTRYEPHKIERLQVRVIIYHSINIMTSASIHDYMYLY